MIPIWRDFIINYPLTSLYFRIRLDASDGPIVYEGRAMAKPGATSVDVGINDICANYLSHGNIDFENAINVQMVSRTFYVTFAMTPTSQWVDVATVEFLNDWSYDDNFVLSRDGLQFPISLVASNRQRLLMTVYSGATVSATLRFLDGTVLSMSVPVRRTADFNNDYNYDYSQTNETKPGVAMLDLASIPGLASVTMGGRTWVIEDGVCHRYALYYINAHGGWDTLLCRGNGIEADNWKRFTYTVPYRTQDPQARGVVDYVNEQSKRWTLRTGWLTDEGAARMHNLLGSTMVYLHDLQEDAIHAVGITTTEAPYKTYMNNGAKLVSYEFEVALQQERVRR